MLYGQALASANQPDEAAAQLRAAIEQEPYFALPYFHLARLLEGQGKSVEAAAQYRQFLARGAKRLGEYAVAQARLAALPAGGAQP